MASLGKCTVCTKTCYQLEGFKVGPPGKEVTVHKKCFKCQNEGCNWQLQLGTYKAWEGKFYCANHCPMRGFSNKEHAKGSVGADAMSVQKAMNAPKLDTVNEQVRSTGAGTITTDAMDMRRALDAPKAAVVNEQLKYDDGRSAE